MWSKSAIQAAYNSLPDDCGLTMKDIRIALNAALRVESPIKSWRKSVLTAFIAGKKETEIKNRKEWFMAGYEKGQLLTPDYWNEALEAAAVIAEDTKPKLVEQTGIGKSIALKIRKLKKKY